MQIFPSWNRDRPKLDQVRGGPLSIEELEPCLVQPLDQPDESHFRSTGNAMKHRLTEKGTPNDDSIKTTDKDSVSPDLQRVRMACPMQADVALDNGLVNPGFPAMRTGANHLRKARILAHLPSRIAQCLPCAVGDMKTFEREDSTRVRRKATN